MSHIEELLPVSQEFLEQYHHYIKEGKEFLSKQNICMVGLTRNTSKSIQNTVKSLVEIGNIAQDYKIILFENDSEDNTVEILQDISKENTNIEYITQTLNREQFGTVQTQARTNALAEYRNILKDYIRDHYRDYDFTIVVDTDFENFSINGVLNSFGWLANHNHIGGMCGNSFEYKTLFLNDVEKSLWNYDCWAYRGSWWHNLQTHNTAKITYNPMFWFGLQILPVGSHPFRINSGFGGMTIYRNNFYMNGNYSGEDCEHVTFHYSLKQKYNDFHLFINPSQIMLMP